jgi:hypothetical protein
VDVKSATLGLPGTREKQIPIDGDHEHICKFEKADGDDYEQVAENLVELADSATRSNLARQLQATQRTPAQIAVPEPTSRVCTYMEHNLRKLCHSV